MRLVNKKTKTINFFAGAAFLVGVAGGSKISQVASGEKFGTPLERSIAADAQAGLAYLKVTRLDETFDVGSATVASRRKVLTSAHNFISLVPECMNRKAKDCPQLADRIKKAQFKKNTVTFSLNPEQELKNGKLGIENQIIDIDVHPDYIIGDESAKNKEHDIALALLKDEIPRDYKPVRFVAEEPTELYIAGYGLTSLSQNPEEHDWIGNMVKVPVKIVKDAQGEKYYLADQSGQKGGLFGDSGGPCFGNHGVIGIFAKNVSPGGVMKWGVITRVSKNLDFLAKAFDRQLAESPNPFSNLL